MKIFAVTCLALALTGPVFGRSLLQAPSPSPAITDTDILNFALQLEYLEAEFYSCAATGSPLSDELRGGGPASTGCQKAKLGSAQSIAEEIAKDEIAHVTFLRQALGSSAVAIPQINIGTAFSDAANAAASATLTPAFSPYENDLFFYLGAFIFEDVGVTAYLGAAGLIDNSTYLTAAAKLLATEAYHAGAVRTLLYQSRDVETPYNVTIADAVETISQLRDTADGTSTSDDQGIVTSTENGEEANLVPTDSNGLAFARTPAQVIDIVTLGKGPSGGGFFPNGLNGFFAATAASS